MLLWSLGPDNTKLECLSFMTSYHEITIPFIWIDMSTDGDSRVE